MWTILFFYFYADNLNSLESTGDNGRQPPRPRATTVDSPPDHGRPESTQEFIIIVYLRLRNRMRYAWTSHLAIDINAHTRIGVCLTYNIAFK